MKSNEPLPTKPLVQYLTEHEMYNMDGGSASILKLGNLCTALGYGRDFTNLYQSSILNFLSDNPGATSAIITYIFNQMMVRTEWEESLKKELEN